MHFPTALALAKLCQQAYTAEAHPIGGEFVAVDPDRRAIAFRGTVTLRQWFEDAHFNLRSFGDFPGQVHTGFAIGLNAAWSELMELLASERLLNPLVPVAIAGHSLGAALATLAAWRLYRSGYQVSDVYLFGAPRVGNRAFATEYCRAPLTSPFRIVNHNDIVPHLPGSLFGYTHIGALWYADAAGRFHDDLVDCDRLKLTWDDHHIDRYVELLRQAYVTEEAA